MCVNILYPERLKVGNECKSDFWFQSGLLSEGPVFYPPRNENNLDIPISFLHLFYVFVALRDDEHFISLNSCPLTPFSWCMQLPAVENTMERYLSASN